MVTDHIIGPRFIEHVAGLTLNTIKEIVEREPRSDDRDERIVSVRRRVAITGIGPITAIGNGVDGLWDGVRRGESAVTAITRFDPAGFSSRVAAEVTFEPLDFMSPEEGAPPGPVLPDRPRHRADGARRCGS